MSYYITPLMRWNAEGRINVNKLWHLTNADASKAFDDKY